MSVALRSLMALSLVVSAAACSKSSSGGPTSPTGPGGSAASAGTWSGTLSRPGGQPAMTVTWQVTVVTTPDDGLVGPMTLTNGANSVTVNAKGNLGGNNSQGYTVFLQLTSNAGDNPAFPTCTVTGNTAANGSDPLPRPYTSLTVEALSVSYNACGGFVQYSGLQNFLQETARLTLTKQ